jgi:hypothetical protein
MTETPVGDWLSILRDFGLIESTAKYGRYVRWGPPGIRAYHEALSNKDAAELEAEIDGFARPSIKRTLPAADVVFVKPGPASVWELAA